MFNDLIDDYTATLKVLFFERSVMRKWCGV